MRTIFRAVVVCIAISVPLGLAAEPEATRKTEKLRQPNLAAAQILIQEAHAKLEAAHKANEPDAGGHAAKAKEHLAKALEEIKLATEATKEKGKR
jgi:hypothetical protein